MGIDRPVSMKPPGEGVAEGGGFEPPVELPPHNLSKVAPSTTRTPLQSLLRPFADWCQERDSNPHILTYSRF